MAPKGPRPLLFLTLVLLAACLAQLSEGASYRQFLNQHVDFPMIVGFDNHAYCNYIMERRGLTRPVCKPTNTFIHAPTSQVQAICRGAGRCHGRNFCDSNSSFFLTICRVAPGSRPGRCVYRGRVQTRKIRVACKQRLPVRFVRIL
ncbi:ribonuclease-like [Gopherus flavomarginatus]|uniref:ribonuclease-like n=1 Tax=Gopherus flavomarginatus TaxID=286002 RepID=UPI0021CC21F0|nr:ribonuclease-like [Gopherus flavomarginatus]XP_050774016.1 ribonuclease-like [Gopherus flavomarginatus]